MVPSAGGGRFLTAVTMDGRTAHISRTRSILIGIRFSVEIILVPTSKLLLRQSRSRIVGSSIR